MSMRLSSSSAASLLAARRRRCVDIQSSGPRAAAHSAVMTPRVRASCLFALFLAGVVEPDPEPKRMQVGELQREGCRVQGPYPPSASLPTPSTECGIPTSAFFLFVSSVRVPGGPHSGDGELTRPSHGTGCRFADSLTEKNFKVTVVRDLLGRDRGRGMCHRGMGVSVEGLGVEICRTNDYGKRGLFQPKGDSPCTGQPRQVTELCHSQGKSHFTGEEGVALDHYDFKTMGSFDWTCVLC